MDLSTLQSVLAPLAEVGKDERTFIVGGQTIVVRPLLPHEEVSVQRFAVSSLEDIKEEKPKKGAQEEEDAMSRADALDYFDRFRIEVIAHSMVEINGTSLRGVDFIETGETTASGVAVKVRRYEAMRKIIRENWSRTMVTTAFTQYGELIESLAQKADELAELSGVDLDTEIERLKDRLSVLKNQRSKQAKGDSGIPKEQIDHFVGMGQRQEEATKDLVAHHNKKETRVPVTAPQAPPPVEQAPPVEAAPPVQPPQEQAPVAKQAEPTPSFEDTRSSFQDGEDPNVMMEEMRILEARKAAQARERERLQQGSVPSKAPSIDGIETYRMPTEELSPRGKPAPKKGKAPELDPTVRGELNPNFGRK